LLAYTRYHHTQSQHLNQTTMPSSSLSAFASGSEDSNNNHNDESDRFWSKYAAWRTAPEEENEGGGEAKDEKSSSGEYKINFQSSPSSSSSSSSSRLTRKRIATATTARGGEKGGAPVTARPSMEAANEEDATNELMMEKIAQVYDDLLVQNTQENRHYTNRLVQQMSMDDPINRDMTTESPTPSPVSPSFPTINNDDNNGNGGIPTSTNSDNINNNNDGGGIPGDSNFLKDLCVTPASGLYGEVSNRAGILEYAFAVEIATGTDPNDIITPMEQKMNDGMLDDLFTDACGEKDENGSISMQRSSNIFRLRSDGLTGLSSQPPDVLLDQECPGSPSAFDTPGVECAVIYGKMTLYLKENADPVIRQAHAYQTLKDKLNNGDFNSAHPGIINTKMVDLDTITNPVVLEGEENPDVENVETIGAGGNSSNKGLIYGIVGGSAGLILLLALMSLRRRKQRQTQRALDLDEEDEAYLQEQQSYPPTLDDVVRSTSSSPNSEQQTRWSVNGHEYLHYSQSQDNAGALPSYDPEDVPIFTDEELS